MSPKKTTNILIIKGFKVKSVMECQVTEKQPNPKKLAMQ